jgi:hypothetical protein
LETLRRVAFLLTRDVPEFILDFSGGSIETFIEERHKSLGTVFQGVRKRAAWNRLSQDHRIAF